MPFAGYADFDACVKANASKGDPKAYCATIMRQAESKSDEGHPFAEIPDEAQKLWMDTFLESFKNNDEGISARAAWAAVQRKWFRGPSGWVPLKAFESLEFKAIWKADRVVYGTASMEMVDKDNQVITADALRAAFRSYLDRGHVLFYHKNIPVGEVIPSYKGTDGKVYESGVHGKALDIVVRLYKDTKMANDVWGEIEAGRLRAFSIGGEVIGNTVTIHDEKGKHERVDRIDLHEISIVPNPANEASFFSIIKSEVKSVETVEKKPYPWDECVADQRANGADDPEAVCAAIKNRTVQHSLDAKIAKGEDEAKQIIRDLLKEPKFGFVAKYWLSKVISLEKLVRDEKSVALNCKNFTEKALAIIEGKAYNDAQMPGGAQDDCKSPQVLNHEGKCVDPTEAKADGIKVEPSKSPEPAPGPVTVQAGSVIVKEAKIDAQTEEVKALKAEIASLREALKPKPPETPAPAPAVKVPEEPPKLYVPPVKEDASATPAAPTEKKSVVPEETKGQPEPSIDWSRPPWNPGDAPADILKKIRGK